MQKSQKVLKEEIENYYKTNKNDKEPNKNLLKIINVALNDRSLKEQSMKMR